MLHGVAYFGNYAAQCLAVGESAECSDELRRDESVASDAVPQYINKQ